ncbi:MAG: hypothetical protein R6U11_00790 [Bacteroidales bacterium]
MRIIRNYIIFVIAMAVFATIQAQEDPRNVIWVHGLDGDDTSWEYYEQIFTNERLMNGHRPNYNTDNGIDYGSNHLRSLINNQLGETAFNNRNIGIGHSMGGLVSRNLDRMFNSNNNFGGIITVTTPNYGAQIANSLLDGSVESAASHALDELSAGPIAQSLPAWIIGGISFGPQVGFTPAFIADLVKMQIDINGEIQSFAGTPTTNNELQVGSSKINQINNYQSELPHISMWASEQSSSHWRLFGSRISESLDPDINDQVFVDYMNQAQEIYEGFHDLHHALGVSNSLAGIFNPLSWITAAFHFNLAEKWDKGNAWIGNSESTWNSLIGAYEEEEQLVFYSVLDCQENDDDNNYDNGELIPDAGQIIPDPEETACRWKILSYNTTVLINHPSDGLIAKPSQILEGLPPGNIYKVENTNHFSVRNPGFKEDEVDYTYEEFIKIWGREDYFKTNRKD